jgi:hypothetical protein
MHGTMGFKEKARDTAKAWLKGMPGAYRLASLTYRSSAVARGMAYVAKRATPLMMGARPIVVVYSSEPKPRWAPGGSAHPGLSALLEGHRPEFESLIRRFAGVRAELERIAEAVEYGDMEPSWVNGFFGGVDAVALYGFLATDRPRRYFEVGSGNSTKFARRAIRNHGLETTITSIDPAPRASIDALCDRVIRQPLEEVDVTLFDELEAGDILFFDGSHHAFMNSDVVTLWLDILPRLKPGVLVQIHDIFLPFDYPNDWVERYYSEQYLLAVALMSPSPAFDVVFASQFVARDPALARLLDQEVGPRALGESASFWLRTRAKNGNLAT